MLLQNKSVKPRWRRKRSLLILTSKKKKKYKTKAKKSETHAETYKLKHLTKSKLNRFYVMIKLRLDMVIFQQQIVWEELYQINDT